MIQTLTLNGGIDKDTNPLYLPEGSVLSRKNCRVASFDGGRVGINVSLKGMQEINASLPSGTNRTIGRVEDAERDQLIFANYNSGGNHGIYKLKNDVVTLLSQGSFWKFNQNYPVDMDILGDYVRLTDNYNPPRKLNVVTVGTPSADNVQVALIHPTSAPTVAIGSDASKKVNKMVGKSFQFATYFIYSDDTYSVLSPYSQIAVSNSVFAEDSGTYVDNSVGNYVSVTYATGTVDVSKIILLAREGNIGSWFVVEEHDRIGSDNRTVTFYNDVAREYLPTDKALALYSDVPLLAKSNVSVQNRIGYAGITKGYDKTDLNFELEVEYEEVNVNGSSLAIAVTDGTDADEFFINFDIPTSVTDGDVFSLSVSGRYIATLGGTTVWEFNFSYSGSYTVVTGDTYSDVYDYFTYDISSKGKDMITAQTEGDFSSISVHGSQPAGGGVNIDFIGVYDASYVANAYYGSSASQDTPPTGVATYKAGSYYGIGGLWYDERSRTSGVLNPTRVYIPTNGERDYADVGKRARIKFTMPASVTQPSWATRFRFAITESINFVGVYPFVTGNDTATNIYDGVYVDGKKCIAINMPTNLQYEFVNGDYLQIEEDDTVSITTTNKVVVGTRSLIEVSGTEYAGFWLIIPQGTNTASDFEDVKCVIYRQKDEVSTLIYYEDFNTYDSMDGRTGYVGEGDAWFTQRTFEWDGGSATEVVEDFSIDPDSALRAYSKGRAVVEFDTQGQITLQDFVWSEPYLDNTKINGTSFFDALNRVQLDEKDGSVQRVFLVGDVLKVIQDNKETSLYVGKEQVTNADGSLQLVKTGSFIGTVYPSVDDYGSRYHDSIVKNNRNMYYWDGDKGEVVRSSPNGQIAISNYGMRSEFQRIADDIKSASSVRVVSGFDEKHNDLIITFSIDGVNQSLVFREGDNLWINDNIEYENANGKAPDLYGSIGNQLYSFLDNAWKHESTIEYNTFYGDSKTLSVRGLLNVSPTDQKAIRSLKIDSNRAPNVIIETPVTNTRPLGQKTVLYPATFRSRLGEFVSAVFKNILTVLGEDLTLIHSNDDVCGFYIEIELTDDGTTEFQLRTVDTTFAINR